MDAPALASRIHIGRVGCAAGIIGNIDMPIIVTRPGPELSGSECDAQDKAS